jgi:hypothetical protein
MATRKPLFLGDVGAEEMAATDGIQLGALSMSGDIAMGTNKVTGLGAASASGQAISYGQASASLNGLTLTGNLAMGLNKITGLGAGTTGSDAVNKSQLDQAVINGGKLKEHLLHENQLDNAAGVLAAAALSIVVNPVSGDTVEITNGTTTRIYAAGTGGDVSFTIGGSVAATMQNLATAIQGDSSGAWSAYFTTDLDSIDADGVVVIVEKTNTGAVSKIYGDWDTQADCQVIDYYGELDYTKKVTDNLPSTVPTNSNFGIRRLIGAVVAGEIHSVENNDTVYLRDQDAGVWQVLTGAAAIPNATSASGGGTKGKVSFDRDHGLVVAAGVASISLATNKGLEFDGSGNLAGKVDATAGLEITSGGFAIDIAASNPGVGFDGSGDLEVKLSGTTLDKDSSGLKVKGLPLQFEINGVSTSTSVTASHVNELVGGGVTTLHTHSTGAATRIEDELTAEETLSKGDPIEWGSTSNKIRQCRANNVARVDCFGVVEESSGIAQDAVGTVVRRGVAAAVLSGKTVGDRVYVGDTGGLVVGLSSIAAGNHVIFVGTMKNATDLEVNPQYIGRKAA